MFFVLYYEPSVKMPRHVRLFALRFACRVASVRGIFVLLGVLLVDERRDRFNQKATIPISCRGCLRRPQSQRCAHSASPATSPSCVVHTTTTGSVRTPQTGARTRTCRRPRRSHCPPPSAASTHRVGVVSAIHAASTTGTNKSLRTCGQRTAARTFLPTASNGETRPPTPSRAPRRQTATAPPALRSQRPQLCFQGPCTASI